MSLRVGSLFSGVGGFDLGLERAGMEVVWQVEYDERAQGVLRHRWPNVDLHKDVCDVGRANLAPVDLICGGFPCQDLSVAGRREGLAGERSGLFYEFMRIVDELAPRWVLVENVPGLLSSNGGRDMGAVLGTLGDLGYGYAYRVLDTQYFGPPQRRRRVFIVGCSRGECRPEVLLESESLPWDSPPSREAWEGATRGVEGGLGNQGGGLSAWTEVSARKWVPSQGTWLAAHEAKEPHTIVAHTLRAEGFDASEDGTGRGTPIVAFQPKASAAQSMNPSPECPTLGITKTPAVLLPFDTTQITSKANRSHPKPGDPCHPLAAGAHAPAVASPVAIPRRLSPRECERLQGFSDDWTKYARTPDGEVIEQSDSARYRQLGNAVSVPVAKWIARRISESP